MFCWWGYVIGLSPGSSIRIFCWTMPWQFLSYAFLHGGIGHILGNMFFLYLFGNSVNDRMGDIKYLLFYCGGAIFSGLGHVLMTLITTNHNIPTLGGQWGHCCHNRGLSGAVPQVSDHGFVYFLLYWDHGGPSPLVYYGKDGLYR